MESMINFQWEQITNNYKLAKKYYSLAAIEYDNHNAMFELAKYYEDIEQNIIKSRKYYLKFISFANINSCSEYIKKYQYANEAHDETCQKSKLEKTKQTIDETKNIKLYIEYNKSFLKIKIKLLYQ